MLAGSIRISVCEVELPAAAHLSATPHPTHFNPVFSRLNARSVAKDDSPKSFQCRLKEPLRNSPDQRAFAPVVMSTCPQHLPHSFQPRFLTRLTARTVAKHGSPHLFHCRFAQSSRNSPHQRAFAPALRGQ